MAGVWEVKAEMRLPSPPFQRCAAQFIRSATMSAAMPCLVKRTLTETTGLSFLTGFPTSYLREIVAL